MLRHESEHQMRGRPAPCWKTGLPQSPHRIFMRPFRVRVGLWDSYRAGSTDRRGIQGASHGGRWMGVCRTAHTYAVLTDILDASVRPSSVALGHPALRSCAHGGTRIGTGACAVGDHQARPCGQPGWPASRTARRCRRAWPCIGAHRAPVRRGGWTPSSAAVAKFGRLSRSRASHLQSYSPAGARARRLDGGAHHGFGARRGAPLVVV